MLKSSGTVNSLYDILQALQVLGWFEDGAIRK